MELAEAVVAADATTEVVEAATRVVVVVATAVVVVDTVRRAKPPLRIAANVSIRRWPWRWRLPRRWWWYVSAFNDV